VGSGSKTRRIVQGSTVQKFKVTSEKSQEMTMATAGEKIYEWDRQPMNDAEEVELLYRYVDGDMSLLCKILVDNPARLHDSHEQGHALF
jgi:hypothetical protein